MRVLSYPLLPNHCHLVVWPRREGELAAFAQKLTITHVRNWHEHRRRVGYGQKGVRVCRDKPVWNWECKSPTGKT